MDTKIANALLGLATEAFVAAQLASRDASITAPRPTRRCWPRTPRTPRSQPASQSALDAILAELAALQLPGSGGVVKTHRPGRASQLGSSRKQRRSQPAFRGSSLCCAGQRRRHAEHHGRLLLRALTLPSQPRCWPTTPQRKWTRCWHGERADASRHHGRAAGLPDGPGPGRVHNQPNHLSAGGAPFSRRPGHGDGLEHRRRPAQLLHHHAGGRFVGQQTRSHGGGLGAADSSALSRTTEGPTRWWQP